MSRPTRHAAPRRTHPPLAECTPVPVAQLATGTWTDWAAEDGITELAQALNRAMADDPAARAAYAAVWGCPWEPLDYCAPAPAYSTGDRYPDSTPHRRTGGAGATRC